jgi:hypothetical protein
MILFLVLALVGLSVLLHFSRPLTPPSEIQLPTNQTGGAGSQPNCGSNFDNFCLTTRPRGHHQSLCTWWRDFRKTRLQRPPQRPRTPPEAGPNAGNNFKFVNIDNEISPFTTQLDGYDLDLHDPLKSDFPPRETDRYPVNPVIWNRTSIDRPLPRRRDPVRERSKRLGERGKRLSPDNLPQLPFQTQPEFTSYDPDYYIDASSFCQRNPRHRLCPNHWVG